MFRPACILARLFSLSDGQDLSFLRERRYAPEEISGMMLEHLIECAKQHLGTEIEGAVSPTS